MHGGPSFFSACSSDLRIRRGLFARPTPFPDNDKGLRNGGVANLGAKRLCPGELQ
jgi:hypothetical protein